eukprot:15450225-Alexandrium_andersonii.AAC.1
MKRDGRGQLCRSLLSIFHARRFNCAKTSSARRVDWQERAPAQRGSGATGEQASGRGRAGKEHGRSEQLCQHVPHSKAGCSFTRCHCYVALWSMAPLTCSETSEAGTGGGGEGRRGEVWERWASKCARAGWKGQVWQRGERASKGGGLT